MLTELFLVTPHGASLAQLARRLGADPATVQREVTRLEAAGVLATERVGNARVARADTSSPIYNELHALLAKAFGPAPILEAALADVRGVDRAYIFGSWARRYHGEPGPLPRDVDLLVVGDADPDAVYRVARDVENRLGVEVNPIVVAAAEWDHPLGLLARIDRDHVVELRPGAADDR